MFTLAVTLIFANLDRPDMHRIIRDYYRNFATYEQCVDYQLKEVHSDPRGREVIAMKQHSVYSFRKLCDKA